MTDTDPTIFDDLERDYVENEHKEKAMVLSIVKAMQDLVTAATTDPQHLVRCNEVCDAVIAFAFKGRREPLSPAGEGRPRDRRRIETHASSMNPTRENGASWKKLPWP